MNYHEVIKLIEMSLHEINKLEKLFNIMDIVNQDIQYVRFSRQTFLPAAKAYLEGRQINNDKFRLRKTRARLGGSSRWLYHRQKQLFRKVLELWLPVSPPESLVDSLWQKIRSAEIRLLKNARRQYLNKH
jgi:hypothetical protein